MHRLEKTRAFLTEFIIVILFFTISSVIVVKLYVAANEDINESVYLTESSVITENICEEIKAYKDFSDKDGIIHNLMVDKYKFIKSDESLERYYMYYDKNFKKTSEKDAYFILYVTVNVEKTESGEMYLISVIMKNNDKTYSKPVITLYNQKGAE